MSLAEKKRLDLAFKASHEGIWKWSYTIDQIYYSELMLEFLGYDDQASAPHIFQEIDRLFHEHDREMLKATLDSFLKPSGTETFTTECRYNHPNGSTRWFRICGASQRDKNGIPTIIAGSVIDITLRKEAELKLVEEKHLLNLLIESIPVNIYFKDKDSKFVMANTATAKKMALHSAENILGKTDHDFFKAKHADNSRQDELNIMATGKVVKGSLEKEIWDNEIETWCITSKYPWHDHRGEIKGTFGVTNDISEIVETQNRLTEVAEIYKERNELFEKELHLASEIQQAILAKQFPQLPTEDADPQASRFSADFDITHIPMHGLAGDFYQAIPISETKMGILLCDVMGHGVRAGLIAAMIRGLMSRDSDITSSPDRFLASLNHRLCHILKSADISIFATAIYCVIDTTVDTLCLASAGHPLPILKRDATYASMVTKDAKHSPAPALGLVPDSVYHSTHLDLLGLEEVIFYTDGIYEVADSEDEELGIETLISRLNKDNETSATSIQKLIKIAKEHTDTNEFNDDVCLVAMNISQ